MISIDEKLIIGSGATLKMVAETTLELSNENESIYIRFNF